jgi:hypothetical protein
MKSSKGNQENLTLDDVLANWDAETQSEEEKRETLEAIQRGLDDMYAGRTRPAEEFTAEFRRKHNLKSD